MNRHYASVAARALHRCEYCRAPEVVFNFPFEVEHLVPPSRGGSDAEENRALACRSCNVFKANCVHATDPQTAVRLPLYNPRSDSWDEHFIVLESGTLEGRTPIGRATIVQLRMNAGSQIAARLQWMRLGLYSA